MVNTIIFGHNPPFLTPSAVLPLQTNERIIKNDLLQLLLTIPGERVMRPSLGTPIRSTVFDPGDQNTVDALEASIRSAIDKWEERVGVEEVRMELNADSNTLNITIFGFIVLSNENNERFEMEIESPVEIRI